MIELEGIVVDSSGILRLKIDDDNSRYAVVIRDGAAFMILIARNYRARYVYIWSYENIIINNFLIHRCLCYLCGRSISDSFFIYLYE